MPSKTKTAFMALLAAFCAAVLSAPAIGDVPRPWALGMQAPATEQARQLTDFHDLLVIIITGITLFVLVLLIYVVIRFRASANPVPSRTAHNTLIEVIWTVVPVVILVVIAIPSFKMLYWLDRAENPDMTLKVIGRQWYWSYEYPDNGNFTFDSTMVPENEIKGDQHRLLEVDNRIVLPVNTDIRLLITASDVLHAWAVPSFGVKMDAVPGRTNETWVRIEKEGVYYGQCSEICGVGHAYMPIAVEAVSKEKFEQWVSEAQQKYARVDGAERVADAAGAR